MLPGIDGFEICKKIREVKNTPIIMVSAKKEDIDKILNKARKGKLNFLYVTPERLQNHAFIEAMQHSDTLWS